MQLSIPILVLLVSGMVGRSEITITLVEPGAMALEKEWSVGSGNLSFGFEQWYAYRPMSGMTDPPPASVPRYTTLLLGPVVVFAPGTVRVVGPVTMLVVVSVIMLIIAGWRGFKRRRAR